MKYNSQNTLHFKNSWKSPVIPATIVPHSTKAMSNQKPLLQWPFEIKRYFTDVSACSVWTFSAGKHRGMVITCIFQCSVWEAAAMYLCTVQTCKIQSLASLGPELPSLKPRTVCITECALCHAEGICTCSYNKGRLHFGYVMDRLPVMWQDMILLWAILSCSS